MNPIAFWSSGDQILILAANVLMQVTVVTGIALVIAAVARRNPAARYGVLWTTLLLVLLTPAVALVMQTSGYGLLSVSLMAPASFDDAASMNTVAGVETGRVPSIPPEPRELSSTPPVVPEFPIGAFGPIDADSFDATAAGIDSARPAPLVASVSASEDLSATESGSSPSATPTGKVLRGVMPPLLSIWIVGTVVLLLRLSIAWWRLATLLRSAWPVTNPSRLAILEQVRRTLRLARTPALVQSPKVSGPISTGLFRPRVVLPEWMTERITDEQLREILIHETAHLLRRDQVTVLLQNISMTIFWLHPLVRVLNRRLALAREEICDNYVLAASDAPTYSRTLLELAQLIQTARPLPGTVGLFTSRWKLDRRVAGLLDESRSRMTALTNRGRALLMVLTAILSALVACGTMTLAVAPAGESVDRLSDTADVSGADDDRQNDFATADADVESSRTAGPAGATFDTPTVDVTGVVVDQGKPIAGAIVQAWYMGWMGRGWRPTTTDQATTDAGGRFAISMPRRRISEIRVVARTANAERMALRAISDTMDPERADVRSWLVDPVRLPGFELNLAPALRREVHVVDSGGKPVESAIVGVYLFSEWDFTRANTDANGTAIVHVPAACNYYEFFAWKPGFALDYAFGGSVWSNVRQPVGDAASPITLTLGRPAELSIRVADAMTNQPVAGATVVAQIPDKSSLRASFAGMQLGYGLSAVTNSEGRATIDWLPEWVSTGEQPAGVQQESTVVRAQHPGYAPAAGTCPFGTNANRFSVTIFADVRLHGRVLHADGRPAEGIVVASWTQEEFPYDRAVTDDDGRYELAAPPDLGTVVAVVDDKWAAAAQTEFDIQVAGASADVADMVLQPAKRVHGRIKDVDNDRAVAGQQIWLQLFGPPEGAGRWPETPSRHDKPHATLTTWTEESGRDEFHVGPVVYEIMAPKDLESTDGVLFARGYSHWSLNLPDRVESREQNFELSLWREGESDDEGAAANAPDSDLDDRVVAGHVVDGNGNPIDSATVVLPINFGFGGKPRNVAQGVSNADGSFRLEVPVDWLEPPLWHHLTTLWVYKEGFALGTANVAPQLANRETSDSVEVLLTAESGPMFTILDETGQAAGGVMVEPQHYRTVRGYEIVPQEILPELAAETDEDGRITIPCMQKGKLFRLLVRSVRHGTQEFRGDTLPEGGELRLREAAPLKGRVIGEDPAWERHIVLRFTTESGRGSFTDAVGAVSVTTDENGKFEVPLIATGGLRIEVALDPTLPVRLRFPEGMAVPAEGELILQLEPAKFVHGRVVRKDGQDPVVGVEVSVRYGQFRQGERAVTDENGEFEARVLAGPVYQQVISIPDPELTQVGSPWNERLEVPSTARDFELPVIELVTTHAQAGRLVDADGNPLANYDVWGVNGNRRYGFAKTNEQGDFEMKLPNGVEIERYGYNSPDDELGEASVLEPEPLRLRAEQPFQAE